MNKFVFSCYVKRSSPILRRRPWWNLWGRDRIEYVEGWKRVHLAGLDQKQADALVAADFLADVWPGLFLKALGTDVRHVQLEYVTGRSAYTPSEYVSTSAATKEAKRG